MDKKKVMRSLQYPGKKLYWFGPKVYYNIGDLITIFSTYLIEKPHDLFMDFMGEMRKKEESSIRLSFWPKKQCPNISFWRKSCSSGYQGPIFGPVKFEMTIRHPGGKADQAAGYTQKSGAWRRSQSQTVITVQMVFQVIKQDETILVESRSRTGWVKHRVGLWTDYRVDSWEPKEHNGPKLLKCRPTEDLTASLLPHGKAPQPVIESKVTLET